MKETGRILGIAQLHSKALSISGDGLHTSKLRVEIFEQDAPGSVWIAELTVVGELPWLKGEEREVELRVMSDEFRNRVESVKPNLLINRGSDEIGSLSIY